MSDDRQSSLLDPGMRYHHVRSALPLPTPQELLHAVPTTPQTDHAVLRAREAVRRVLDGKDPRLAVVVGPASIHDPGAAIEYADRLNRLAFELSGSLLLVMRVHVDKPRAAFAWNGLLVDPYLDGSCRMDEGLLVVRRIMTALAAAEMPMAITLSDPWAAAYLVDLASWVFLGALSGELRLFREMASGLPCPVGFKNSQNGALDIAIHAIVAAARSQHTYGLTEEGLPAYFDTVGNPHGHLVMRAASMINQEPLVLERASQALAAAGLPARLIVECGQAHAHEEAQVQLFRAGLAWKASGGDPIRGMVLYSNLMGGSQPLPVNREELRPGVSITEPCLDWQTTEMLLREAADAHARVLAGR
jgi:3-deoxy-7-phosphoheptulonate synthase